MHAFCSYIPILRTLFSSSTQRLTYWILCRAVLHYSHEQKFKTTSQKCRFSVIGMLLHQPNSIVASYIFSLHCFAFSANFYFCSHFLVDFLANNRFFEVLQMGKKKVIKRGSEGPDSCPTWAKPI